MALEYLKRARKPSLAYHYTPGQLGSKLPLLMFCGGYRSDMNGTKALYLKEQCAARGQAYLRFDYSGHGQSEGRFEDLTMGDWKSDAIDIFDHVVKGPVVIIGSSMGGWITLLLSLARPHHIKGLIGVAAAPDFTEEMHAHLNPQQKEELSAKGHVKVPADYSLEPYNFTLSFYEEAKNHLLLRQRHSVTFPMRFIQGKKDNDVPWRTALKIQESFQSPDFEIILIDDGDHRLSRPEDLMIIDREARRFSGV